MVQLRAMLFQDSLTTFRETIGLTYALENSGLHFFNLENLYLYCIVSAP